jgi:hypothetical protein
MARKENALFALCALCLPNTAPLNLNWRMVTPRASSDLKRIYLFQMPLVCADQTSNEVGLI